MTKKEVIEIFNQAFVEYLGKLGVKDISDIALIIKFEKIFLKKLNEKRKSK